MFKRKCPECSKEINYKRKQNFNIANKNKSLCKSCTKLGDKNWTRKPENKWKLSGENNPMYGKSLYDVWLDKYGKDEADKKLLDWKLKISLSTSGKNNPMYGKPSPKGSGNGWSGWYKDNYFRSLLELSYLVHLYKNNIKFISAESKKYAIQYEMDGKERNYFYDYILESGEHIEIKPKKLITTFQNTLKFDAAKEKLGSKFKIITEEDIDVLDNSEILQLYLDNNIKFIDRYDKKFKEIYIYI